MKIVAIAKIKKRTHKLENRAGNMANSIVWRREGTVFVVTRAFEQEQ